MDRLLLLIPTTAYRVSDFLEAAHRLGVDVAVGSNRRQVLEAYSDGGTVTVNFRNIDKGVAQIAAYADRYPLTAVVPVDDEPALLAAKASEALALPHNSPGSVAATRNKYRFRTVLAEAGLPSPEFRLLSIRDGPSRAARDQSYPCVLKPLSLAASRGVIRADDPDSFIAAFRRIAAILHAPDSDTEREETATILVEGYIPGIEVALEGLLDDGQLHVLALFDKPDPLEGPYFEESIYVTPSRLPATDQQKIVSTAAAAVTALGLRDGPIHAELRLNDEGAWVIELAARSIGGLCARVLRFGADIRLEELILRHALGLPIETMARERCAAGVMMIPIPGAGTLRAIDGLEAARSAAGVEDVTITIPIGQPVVPLPEGDKYLGFIFAKGETPEAVETSLRTAHDRLDFEIAASAKS